MRLNVVDPTFSGRPIASVDFSDNTSGSAMLISNLAILRFPVLLIVSSMSCRVPCLPFEILNRDDIVILSTPTACKALTCHAEDVSKDR
jgi:hypothetical protein